MAILFNQSMVTAQELLRFTSKQLIAEQERIRDAQSAVEEDSATLAIGTLDGTVEEIENAAANLKAALGVLRRAAKLPREERSAMDHERERREFAASTGMEFVDPTLKQEVIDFLNEIKVEVTGKGNPYSTKIETLVAKIGGSK